MSRKTNAPAAALKKAKSMALTTAVSMGLTAAAFLPAPLVNYDPDRGSRRSGILASIVLWLLIAVSLLSERELRRLVEKAGVYYPTVRKRKSKPGIIAFAMTPAGRSADLVMGAAALLYLSVLLEWIRLPYVLRMLPFSLLTAAVLLHCLFNGKAYSRLYRMTLRAKKEKREESGHE